MSGKPLIHLIEAGQKIPFDVASSRTIQSTLDLSGARAAVSELQRQAKAAVEEGARVESPISVAIDLKALKSSDDPAATALNRIENEIALIKEWISMFMEDRIDEGLDEIIRIAEDTKRFSWTDENVEELKRLWNLGLSASQIAKMLGSNRNAVIGKVHRLGMPHRNRQARP